MKVIHVQLLKAIFVPGGSSLPRTVTNSSQSCPGIEMDIGDWGVVCTWKSRKFLIPWNQVEAVVLDVQEN